MWHDDSHVITGDVLLIWDGITQPDRDEKTGQVKHNVKVAIPGDAPELAEITQLANKALQNGQFKGQLPPGGNWPIAQLDTTKQGLSHLSGYQTINAKTQLGAPPVFDANGQELNSMSYSGQLYPGVKLRLMIHAYDFNNVQKGIAFGLDGVQIIDPAAPKLEVGGGPTREQVASAFGGAPAQQPPQSAPAPAPATPPPAPAPEFPNGPQPGPQMTARAQGVPYEAFKAQGWTDDQLREHGYMT